MPEPTVTYSWNVIIPKSTVRSKDQAILEVSQAIPVSGEISGEDGGENWLLTVPSQVATQDEVEKKLLQRGISARVRLVKPAG